MSRYVGFVIAFVFWSSGESAAQNQISLTRRLLTIRVEVNDTTGLFLVDTGSDCTIIDSAFARRLGLKSSGIALVERNYSKEEEITTTAEKVRIGAKPWSSVPLVLLDLSMLSRVQGAPISGILGTDLLTRITMRLSYSSGVAGIADEIERGSLPVALDKVRGRYFVPVNIGATPKGSPAEAGGGVVGDRIISVNGPRLCGFASGGVCETVARRAWNPHLH